MRSGDKSKAKQSKAKQKKYVLRKVVSQGLVSCSVSVVLLGSHLTIYAQENSSTSSQAGTVSNRDDDLSNKSDEKTHVSEVNPDTDEVKVTVTRTIYFKEKETNRDLAKPITQTIEVKQSSTGNYYYFNHENKEHMNSSILPEVVAPQMNGYTPDREVVQAVDVSNHVYNKFGKFRPRITHAQAIIYYTNTLSHQEQPSLNLLYTEEELKAKEQLTARVNLDPYKYELNGQIHREMLTYSDFIYDKHFLKNMISNEYRSPMYRLDGFMNASISTVKLDKSVKYAPDEWIAFHRDYEPNVQVDFIYTLNQYYLDENGEKVPIFETPSTMTYHLDENGLSMENHLQELNTTGEVKIGSGAIILEKGSHFPAFDGVRYQIKPHTIIPKVFEHDGNLYIPSSKKITLRDVLNLHVDYISGETPRQATYSADVIYHKVPRSEALDALAKDSADKFTVVVNGFDTLSHKIQIPVTSHYSWDEEKGLRVTYELKDKDVTQFSDEKVQFEEISFVDLNTELDNYDKHMAKPTQAMKVRYKLFVDKDKHITKEEIAKLDYKDADDSNFEIKLGRMVLKEEEAIQNALTHSNESFKQDFAVVKDVVIKYDKDGKHLTGMPTAVRVAFTHQKQYRLNGNVLEETVGDIVPVADIRQTGLQLQDLRILDLGNVNITDKHIDLSTLNSYPGMDKDKILAHLNKRLESSFKQSAQARVFLLVAKDRIHEANPAYHNEFHSDYIIYPIIFPGNEIPYSITNTYSTTIHYHVDESDESDAILQTKVLDASNDPAQIDNLSISNDSAQTENLSTLETDAQTEESKKKGNITQIDNSSASVHNIQTDELPDLGAQSSFTHMIGLVFMGMTSLFGFRKYKEK